VVRATELALLALPAALRRRLADLRAFRAMLGLRVAGVKA